VDEMTLPLPCFACGKALEPVAPDRQPPTMQAYDAVMFSTPGNYGSTVFDEMDGTRLVLNICDQCLRDHPDRVVLSTPVLVQRVEPTLSRWEPPTDEMED
jgi:hypothetical protein